LKLYEVPRNSRIKVIGDAKVAQRYKEKNIKPELDEVLSFKKIDGMYSLCYNSKNEPVHLVAWSDVEVLESVGDKDE